MRKKVFLFLLIWVLAVLHISSLLPGEGSSEDEKSEQPTVLAQEFVDLLQTEEFSRAFDGFDETMKKALPPEKLQDVWQNLTGLAGQFRNQVGLQQDQLLQYVTVIITCDFEIRNVGIKIVFDENKKITGLWFMPAEIEARDWSEEHIPEYVQMDSFQEKETFFGDEERMLPGMLTIPKREGPFPIVVLVHDSGPYDRDETVGRNKPFQDIAWGLASRGIAALRYEKRPGTFKRNTISLLKNFTIREETIDDALAAISMLRQMVEIDSAEIFILGHGLGGMVIPKIEKNDPNIAGSIIMAGMTRSLEDVYYREKSYIFSLDGDITKAEKAELKKLKSQISMIKDPKLSERKDVPEELLSRPIGYWLDIREYHPAVLARELTRPMLILQGGRDYQVTLDDFRGWKKHLTKRENVEFKLYLKLNHLFMEGKVAGKSSPKEYQIPGHVDEKVIKDIVKWIGKLQSGKVTD